LLSVFEARFRQKLEDSELPERQLRHITNIISLLVKDNMKIL
jgi:hypothetical protein